MFTFENISLEINIYNTRDSGDKIKAKTFWEGRFFVIPTVFLNY
jgi:hypothetical protein